MKHQKQKSEKKIPFDIATRKIKYLGINLTKEVKDPYSENYTTLKEEIKEDTDEWEHIPGSWIGRINIIKIAILPKAMYRFNTTPIKVPMAYFTDIEQTLQKYLFIFREKRREGEREGEKHRCVVASHVPSTGDLACNPGMCPDWESNQQPFGLQAGTQSTESHQPGQNSEFFRA